MNSARQKETDHAKAIPSSAKSGRRYKAYAAMTGVSYRYFFEHRQPVVRPEGQGAGSDFCFVVAGDQRAPFTLRIFLSDRALEAWRRSHGRALDANEQYAAAKMLLFRAFDEIERPEGGPFSLVVDEANIEELVAPLELA